MAKITWTFKNEEGTNLNRYIATNVSTGEKITLDLLRGGNISVVGTPLNAENLNALITSINACYDLISSSEKDTTYTLSKNGNAIRLTSSNGAINDVTLNKSDIGLGNVDNTSDMDKPISNATQTELNKKANTSEVNAKIDEVKQEFDNHIVECNCTHEVEITGFGEEDCNLAIDDQDVVITKIQGQTRRKSLNLLNIADGKVTLVAENVSYKSVHYTMPCKSNTTYTISIKYNQSANNGHLAIITHYTDENPLEDSSGTIFKTLTTLDETTMQFNFYATTGTAATNTINFTEIMVVEGTYTKDTMPPFEPYDNNLVNSKCDFISTGRNLCNGILEFYNTYLYVIRGCRLKPNTTYTISSNLVLGGNFIVTVAKNTWDESIKLTSDYGNFPTTFTTPSTLEVGDDWIIAIRGTFTNSNNGNVMLNYGDTALPYEPNVEDTMKCGLELGAFDYHDNVNNITHRQTSEKWTWVPSQSIRAGGAYTYGYRLDIKLFNDTNMGETKGISNWEYNFNMIANPNVNNNNSICVFNQHLYVFVNGATSESEARAVLDANPPQLVYKRTTETTETNILPSGYKVWYKGMQIQKTDTLPYILTKQYAISLASQVLNNVSVDRSQQKQIDELKTISENKLNAVYFEIAKQISNVDNFITYLNNSNINIGDFVGKIMVFRTSIGDDEFDYIIIPSYYDYTGFLICEDNIYHLYFDGDTYAVGKYLREYEINNKFGGFKFTKKGNVNEMYVDSDLPLISNYNEEAGTQGTIVGNIDSELLLRGAQARPKFTNGFTTSAIALSTDLDAITKRLDDLGFKEGVVYYDGTAVDNTLATIKKQGKIAILNAIAPALGVSTISVPAEFKPKEETTIMCMASSTSGIPIANTIKIKTDGTITTPSNFVKIVNAAWELA